MSETNVETALRNEATGSTATFEFRGESFTVPLEFDDLPVGYMEAVGDGANMAVQARELLGPEQWAVVRAMNLTGRGLNELRDALDSATGVSAGNSPASSA